MNIFFLVRSFNDRSETEPFSILELSNSKDWLKSMMTAYVKQFIDDHDEVIAVEETDDNRIIIRYNWMDDEEEHSCTFAIIGGRSELFFHHEE